MEQNKSNTYNPITVVPTIYSGYNINVFTWTNFQKFKDLIIENSNFVIYLQIN